MAIQSYQSTNIFQRGISAIQRAVSNVGRAVTRLFNIGGGVVSYPDWDADKAIIDGYEGNGPVYVVINKDAKKFASIPRYVYKVNGKERESIENDLSKLLNRPNEYQGQDAFFQAVKGFYTLTGETFIWLNRGDTSKVLEDGSIVARTDMEIDLLPVLEMYVIPSNKMLIVPDPLNIFGVESYIFEISGKRYALRKNDVIHWKNQSMCFDGYDRKHLRGMTPLKPGKKILQQNNDATDSAVRMYQNDGARGVLANETFDKLSIKQQADVKDVVDSRINNNEVKGAVATMQGKWTYTNLGGTAVDMDLLKAIDLSLRQICMLFDVPFEFYQDTTYENKEKAMKGWIHNSIIPACKQFDDELNRMLLKAFKLIPGTYKIATDFSELPELQVDMSLLTTQLMNAWWITPNEKRKAMNYELSDNPLFDEPWIPSGMTPLSQLNGDGFDEIDQSLQNEGVNDGY